MVLLQDGIRAGEPLVRGMDYKGILAHLFCYFKLKRNKSPIRLRSLTEWGMCNGLASPPNPPILGGARGFVTTLWTVFLSISGEIKLD